jgi:ferredoxin
MTTLNINGRNMSVDAAGDTPLLWAIREQLQMTGTKFGCGIGMCGACTVHVNDPAAASPHRAATGALIEERAYRLPFTHTRAFSIMEKMGEKLDQQLLQAFRPVAFGSY